MNYIREKLRSPESIDLPIARFHGKYHLPKLTGEFRQVLIAMKMNLLQQEGHSGLTFPELEIFVRDLSDDISITHTQNFGTFTNTFKLNQEFEATRFDGEKVRAIVTKQGNKLIEKHFTEPVLTIKYERNMSNLKVILECEGVSCTRKYLHQR